MAKFGLTNQEWNTAKKEIRKILIDRAKVPDTILYSELANNVKSIQLEAHENKLFHMIGEISTEEAGKGRGMLSAIVVTKDDGLPGTGFFELAEDLGRDVTDRLRCWTEELNKVYAYWK